MIANTVLIVRMLCDCFKSRRRLEAEAARTLGLETASLEIRRAEDIAPAFEGLKGRAEALYILPDPLLFTHRLRINTSARGCRRCTAFGSTSKQAV
jgi:hypothetical protein